MDKDRNALQLVIRQGGVLRVDQALDCGITNSSIDRRVRAGKWYRLSRGIYRLVDMDQPFDRVRAAVSVLPNAVVSHETAAEIHKIPRLPSGTAVVTVPSKTTHIFPGVTVHLADDLDDAHVSMTNGFPTTSLPRTLCDLAATLHPRHLAAIVDDQISAQRVDLDELETVINAIRRRGKPGAAVLGSLLDERRASGAPLATRLERLGLNVIAEAGLPRPVVEFPAPWDHTRRIDAAYPEARVGIEWDSKRWHTQVASFENDRRRDRLALLHGWQVFRFTWEDVHDRPHEIVGAISNAVVHAITRNGRSAGQ